MNKKIRNFGDGSYPNESTGKSATWKSDFWGSNYDRLAQIKKTWDPDNVFIC
jgi:FAD/FMN-containing dehydrogenase